MSRSRHISFDVIGKRKNVSFLQRQVFVNDARHVTIIWVLTALATHELEMTDEVNSNDNWLGHMHKRRCSMSRKYAWTMEEEDRSSKLTMILLIPKIESSFDQSMYISLTSNRSLTIWKKRKALLCVKSLLC